VLRLFAGYQSEFDVDRAPLPRARVLALPCWRCRCCWRSGAAARRPVRAARAGLDRGLRAGRPAGAAALWLLYPPRERLDELPLRAGPRLPSRCCCARPAWPAARRARS
jgi:hypothetical protein